jgi:hypothetical protein
MLTLARYENRDDEAESGCAEDQRGSPLLGNSRQQPGRGGVICERDPAKPPAPRVPRKTPAVAIDFSGIDRHSPAAKDADIVRTWT